jgi:hypothetical protein
MRVHFDSRCPLICTWLATTLSIGEYQESGCKFKDFKLIQAYARGRKLTIDVRIWTRLSGCRPHDVPRSKTPSFAASRLRCRDRAEPKQSASPITWPNAVERADRSGSRPRWQVQVLFERCTVHLRGHPLRQSKSTHDRAEVTVTQTRIHRPRSQTQRI